VPAVVIVWFCMAVVHNTFSNIGSLSVDDRRSTAKIPCLSRRHYMQCTDQTNEQRLLHVSHMRLQRTASYCRGSISRQSTAYDLPASRSNITNSYKQQPSPCVHSTFNPSNWPEVWKNTRKWDILQCKQSYRLLTETAVIYKQFKVSQTLFGLFSKEQRRHSLRFKIH